MFKTNLLDRCFYDSMVDLLRETVIMIFINHKKPKLFNVLTNWTRFSTTLPKKIK